MKSERGAITLVTLATVVFILAFLLSSYVIIMNRLQAQAEIKRETGNLYGKDVDNLEEIYKGYFAAEDETIPIYTTKELFKIGTGNKIPVNGKIYTFSSSANYILMNDISFEVEDYKSQYPASVFPEKTWSETANSTVDQVKTFTYGKKAAEIYTVPVSGIYKLQVWGAQGGYRTTAANGGKGGYSVGNVTLTKGENLYVYVGGAGGSGNTNAGSVVEGGYNGGGYRYGYKGGGGATDIRIMGGTWNDSSSLLSRIIVAGGGGSDGATGKKGMYGGGTEGGSSTESYTAFSNYCGKGGKSTYSGYSTAYTITTQATTGLNSNSQNYYCGGFGFGGGGVYLSSGYGGAGGGGWYGGSGSVPDGSGDDDRGGGGGSGFVWTSETASNVPSGYIPTTKYYLTDAETYDGSKTFESTSGGTETGHSGDGYAKITLILANTEVTGNRWNNIEDQIANGTFTGNFDYNGKIIRETDSRNNVIEHSS